MERDLFLENIARRLKREPRSAPSARVVTGVSEQYRANPFGEESLSHSDWPQRFADELTALGGTALIAESGDDLRGMVEEVVGTVPNQKIFTWARSEFDGLDVEFLWDRLGAVEFCTTGAAADERDLLERVDMATIGVTTVSFAVVNTGTIVLYTNSSRNRSVSLLPTLHLALIRESQLVGRLGEAFPDGEEVGSAAIPSSIHCISGPSRSADIENDLTIGVHGPAAVTAVICKGI